MNKNNLNLMIDDFVQEYSNDYSETYIVKVEKPARNGVYDKWNHFHEADWIEPILFTPEIMEKNKFKLNEKKSEFLSKLSKTKVLAYDFPEVLGNSFFVEYDTKNKVAYLTDHCFIAIKYVHEFQHLLRLMERKAPEVKEIADNFIV